MCALQVASRATEAAAALESRLSSDQRSDATSASAVEGRTACTWYHHHHDRYPLDAVYQKAKGATKPHAVNGYRPANLQLCGIW